MSKQEEISKEVGTELIFENDRIKVWSMGLQPGQSSHYHRHENDYVFVYTTPSKISSYRDGSQATPNEFEEGYVQYTEVGGGIEHSITNVADTWHHQIILELKGPSVSTDPRPPENNGKVRSSS
ncbi:hypothetical protein FIL93_00110 [SAR202 cluster bacterium AD-493-K16_JPT_193m]|nr:hypothetical protein [SAR202 cluster bacterium AD-493-K16_JPT_193m]|tara:strand:+ start:697 stop:1068 length:372 start_codon:yes stop_codon:yes gene_type:complete